MLRSFTRPMSHPYVQGTRTMVASCTGCHCDLPSRQSHCRRPIQVSFFVMALTEPLQRQSDIARRQNVRVMKPNILKDGAVDADTWCPTLNARRETGWKYVDWLAIAGGYYRAGRASKTRRFLVANHGANGHHGVRRRIHISWSAEVRWLQGKFTAGKAHGESGKAPDLRDPIRFEFEPSPVGPVQGRGMDISGHHDRSGAFHRRDLEPEVCILSIVSEVAPTSTTSERWSTIRQTARPDGGTTTGPVEFLDNTIEYH